MFFGVAYYPEHWPEENWYNDAQKIKACNFDGVRIGEFAWCRMEPEEGRFDFSWLDRAVNTLGQAGLKVVLGTPTATPPAWLTHKHPEILPVDGNGVQMKPGVRKHYCHTNPIFRDYSRQIVEKMAEHYKDNPYVYGWQIDNEFGDHDTVRCYCGACQQGFIDWCKTKYGDLKSLNQAWGTVFWSQEYSAWEQVDLPYPRRPIGLNPSHLLDYYRFASDQVIEFARIQERILRRTIAPAQRITTNLIATFWEIDFRKLAETLDFISWDCYTVIDAMTPIRYPAGSPPPPVDFPPRPAMVSLVHDLLRAFKKKPFWVMETAGQDRLVTYHTLAHGGEGINLFSWKGPRFGAEQGRGGFESHGSLTSRFFDCQQIGRELQTIGAKVDQTTYRASIGLLYSFEMGWAYDINYVYPRSTWIDGVGYWRLMEEFYTHFWSRNIPVEPVDIEDDLSNYALILVPTLYITNPSINQKLCEYVRQGGILIMGPASGTKDWNNVYLADLPPDGSLKDLFGCSLAGEERFSLQPNGATIEMDGAAPFSPGERLEIVTRSTKNSKPGFFNSARPREKLSPIGASVIARFSNGEAAGTLNQYGQGIAMYLGFIPGDAFFASLIDWLIQEEKTFSVMKTPSGVEATLRCGAEGSLLFLVNHNFVPTQVELTRSYVDLLSGRVMEGTIKIQGQHSLILQEVETQR